LGILPARRNDDALQTLKGVDSSRYAWPLLVIYSQAGRIDYARAAAAEFLKTGPHSILAESCEPLCEPMKQKYLDDLGKAGLPERGTQGEAAK
jgi:hypothetical protein